MITINNIVDHRKPSLNNNYNKLPADEYFEHALFVPSNYKLLTHGAIKLDIKTFINKAIILNKEKTISGLVRVNLYQDNIKVAEGYMYGDFENEDKKEVICVPIKKIDNITNIKMETMEKKSFLVFAGTSTRYLAEKICDSLGCELGKMSVTRFADGEFEVCFEESVRGRDVFLVQSTFPSADNLMELLLMVDAAKRASARTINAVVPYFGWARQDRKSKPRVSIAAKLVADMFTVAGIDRLITMDLHADQEQGFFNVPVDHLYASSVLLPYIESLKLENLVIASPDVGGSKRASSYAKYFNCPMVMCNKTRKKANEVAHMDVIGDVEGADVVLIDDMVDTAGTITKAADLLKEKGARTVRALASHCIMSGPANERVDGCALEEMIFTDSIPYHGTSPKVKRLSVAELIANTIRSVQDNESISDQYLI